MKNLSIQSPMRYGVYIYIYILKKKKKKKNLVRTKRKSSISNIIRIRKRNNMKNLSIQSPMRKSGPQPLRNQSNGIKRRRSRRRIGRRIARKRRRGVFDNTCSIFEEGLVEREKRGLVDIGGEEGRRGGGGGGGGRGGGRGGREGGRENNVVEVEGLNGFGGTEGVFWGDFRSFSSFF